MFFSLFSHDRSFNTYFTALAFYSSFQSFDSLGINNFMFDGFQNSSSNGGYVSIMLFMISSLGLLFTISFWYSFLCRFTLFRHYAWVDI
jgi:hypothetical protein